MTDQPTAVMTVEFSLTKQAEAYTSIRVGGTIPVFVTPDNDLEYSFGDALAIIREKAQAEIDAEFEAVGRPAPYSAAPRGRLLVLSADKLAAIVPVHIHESLLPDPWPRVADHMTGHRLDYIRAKAPREWPGYTIVNCADGDLSRLPRLDYVWLFTNTALKLAVLTSDAARLPDDLKKQAGSWWNSTSRLGLPDGNRAWVATHIERETLLDCRDGDFEPVRDFYARHVIEKTEDVEDEDLPCDDDPDEEDEEL